MKAAEIRELSTEELMKKEAELREDSLNFLQASLKIHLKLNKLARILLVLKQY